MRKARVRSSESGVWFKSGVLVDPNGEASSGTRTMTYVRRISALATALLLAALAGCAGGDDPAATQSPTPSSPAPTTATSTPPTDSEKASAAASAVLREYNDVGNQLRQDPSQPLSRLQSVATSTELAAQRNLLRNERKRGLHQVGDTKIAVLKVESVNLDNSDPSTGKVPTVQVDVCFDVSNVDVVNANGESIISPDRPDTSWIQFLVSNYRWDKDPDRAWRVASSQDLKRKPCDAS
ncbi:hypothetical protein [Nocardioides pocheonensis]|nr:hypothetical protein [Nocardioides pocheonensis]